jgi:hypothetical protein
MTLPAPTRWANSGIRLLKGASVLRRRHVARTGWPRSTHDDRRVEELREPLFPRTVNFSACTYDLVKSRSKVEYRGKLDAKGNGEIDMYFIAP